MANIGEISGGVKPAASRHGDCCFVRIRPSLGRSSPYVASLFSAAGLSLSMSLINSGSPGLFAKLKSWRRIFNTLRPIRTRVLYAVCIATAVIWL